MSEKTKKIKQDSKPKKPYSSPVFKHFGAISELTTGGTQNIPEGLGPPPPLSLGRRP